MTLVLPATDPPERGRWCASLCAVLAVHAAAAAGLTLWRAPLPSPAEPPAAILMDLAPAPTPPAVEPAPEPVPEPPPVPPEPEPLPPEPGPLPLPEPLPIEEPPPVVEVPVPLPPPKPKPRPVERRPTPPPRETPPHRAPEAPVAAPAAPAAPAPAAAPVSPPGPVVASWRGALLRHLERYKRYPRAAQLQRLEGVAQVRVTLDRQGAVLAARLETGSGHAVLDGETLEMVRRASPLPAPPPEMASDRIDLVVPVEFALR